MIKILFTIHSGMVQSSSESLFTYRASLGWDEYRDENFLPYFQEPQLPNGTNITDEEVSVHFLLL